ncbi:SNF2 family N-terminal domain-containing protein [Neurospora tetraspora]|uniref:SNF2 family N-terminal domain-containing protein n=1 Tax=Neurospora tetraspora TaxID=94610 RepID=A0AAE0JCR6_9PEZI|nr:SNF2 family N-terminal domain-containing protein [Neurospora tetraspora]
MASRRQRSDSLDDDDSFSDEDLDFINSQATDDSISMSSSQQDLSFASSRGSNGTPKNKNNTDVVDLTASSPTTPSHPFSGKREEFNLGGMTIHGLGQDHASTPIPKFGQPTQLVSQFTPVNTSNNTKKAASRSGGGNENKHALNPSPHGNGGLGASSHAIGGSKYNNLFNDRGKNRPEFHKDLYRSSGPLKANAPPAKPSSTTEIKRNSMGMQLFSSLDVDPPAPPPLQPGRGTASKGAAAAFGENVFYTDPDKAKEDLKALLEGGLDDEESEDEGAKAKTKGAVSESKKKEESIVSSTGHLAGLAVPLLPHQVEGVRWMINRELGPLKRGRVPKGGLLADDMGLGKTLQSISLIIGNRKPASSSALGWKVHFKDISKATLVVAPLALIRQWEAELKDRVMPDLNIKVCVHHGPKRSTTPSELTKYDVVITTYQILVSEHDKSHPDPNKGAQAGCFGVHWFRVILDEAHSIKNRNTKAAKACCALRSEYRWCLTGTPMQNNLDELQSLIHFLRIAPYDNLAEWRAQIDAPMKQGKGHIAIQRLHSILRCFMKRRTKEVLTEKGALVAGGKEALAKAEEKGEKAPEAAFKVTERKVVTIETEFSPAEKAFYKALEERADQSLEKMMKGRTVNYANALVLLLRLRQACNHPRLAQTKLDKDRDALSVDSATAPTPAGKKKKNAYDSQSQTSSVDDLADMMGGMGIQTRQCDMCLGEMTKKEIQEGQLRCRGCEDSLSQLLKEQQSTQESVESKGSKKHKKKKKKVSVVKEKVKVERKTRGRGRKVVVDSDDEEEEEEDEEETPKKGKKSRDNRKRVVDSDDEEDEGTWLVGESQRSTLDLGVAGGTDDENAEGTGEDIDSNEEISEDSEDPEQDSFVVKDSDDDDDDDDESVDEDSIVGSGDEDDTFASVSKLSSQVLKQSESEESETATSSEEESDISESELDDSSETDSEAEYGIKKRTPKAPVQISSKIHELIAILRREAPTHKFIVFSQFTSMLDLVEPFLRHHLPDIKHVRYDGKMPNDAREASLHSLRKDPRTRVLLCSLKCGSLGLNLTAATRVIIVEPFWNPFVEEQAIDRVHRLTQTVDVVVYKLTVRGTVEARILELQDKKRLLAQAAVEGSTERGKKKGQGLKLGLQEILDLFRHDGSRAVNGANGGSGSHVVEENEFAAGSRTPARRSAAGAAAKSNTGARREHEVFGRRW